MVSEKVCCKNRDSEKNKGYQCRTIAEMKPKLHNAVSESGSH